MNLKNAAIGFFKLSKPRVPEMSVPQLTRKKKNTKFSFGLYGLVTSFLLGSVAGINWLVDPLWYGQGNILTGKNFAFNERITKTNLFLRTKDQAAYDCIILGSSRVTALRKSEFTNHNCFNYALKGAEIPDFVNYAFSAMTLLGVSPDPGSFYDQNFEPVDFKVPPTYSPKFYPPAELQKCDLSSVETFSSIREFFPNAKFVAYVPPRSAWSMINDTYGRGLMDCYLSAFHQLSQRFDVMYDFSIPSEVTQNPDNTFDGSHYSVTVNNRIAKILQGESDDTFGVRVDQYNFDDYRAIYRQKLRDFLAQNDELERWDNRSEVMIDLAQEKTLSPKGESGK